MVNLFATRRLIVIDDNEKLHEDFRKVFGSQAAEPCEDEQLLFEESPVEEEGPKYELTSALQGREGFDLVCRGLQEGQPFDAAFVDMRMPPGWDGLKTICALWEIDPNLHVVVCTAFSDYTFHEIRRQVARPERLMILKKPFEPIEVRQAAAMASERTLLCRKSSSVADEVRVEAQRLVEMATSGRTEFEIRNASMLLELAATRAGSIHGD